MRHVRAASRRERGRGVRRRARTAEAKAARRETIVSAAWDLFRRGEFGTVTVARVARRARVAKGTVYLYFETKEELFFEVAYAELDEWLTVVEGGLRGQRPRRVSGVVALMCDSLEPRRDLLRALSLFPTMFAGISDLETLIRIKGAVYARIAGTGACLERALPFLSPGEGARLLLRIQALVIGLWKMSEPLPAGAAPREVAIDFFTEFRATVAALLRGLEARTG